MKSVYEAKKAQTKQPQARGGELLAKLRSRLPSPITWDDFYEQALDIGEAARRFLIIPVPAPSQYAALLEASRHLVQQLEDEGIKQVQFVEHYPTYIMFEFKETCWIGGSTATDERIAEWRKQWNLETDEAGDDDESGVWPHAPSSAG